MPLNDLQYNKLMKNYDRIRYKNLAEEASRKRHVYNSFPVLKDIEDELFKERNNFFQGVLSGTDTSLSQKEIDRLEKEKADIINAHFPKDYLEPIYDCPLCKDTGLIDNVHCPCFKKTAIELLYAESNHKNVNKTHTFENFDYSLYPKDYIIKERGMSAYDNIVRITEHCKNFVKNFDSHNDNIFLFGNVGVGKTYLTDCIFNALVNSLHTVIYLTAIEFFTLLENAKFDNDFKYNSDNNIYNSLLDCDLLIIDDLGTEMVTNLSLSNMFHYINDRLLRNKSTVISSNYEPRALRDTYSERVISRITGNYDSLRIYGNDLRNL